MSSSAATAMCRRAFIASCRPVMTGQAADRRERMNLIGRVEKIAPGAGAHALSAVRGDGEDACRDADPVHVVGDLPSDQTLPARRQPHHHQRQFLPRDAYRHTSPIVSSPEYRFSPLLLRMSITTKSYLQRRPCARDSRAKRQQYPVQKEPEQIRVIHANAT
jgi:hypothetical protein